MTTRLTIRKIIVGLCLLLSCHSLLAQDLYLQGKIKACNNEWIFLWNHDTNRKIDSTICKNEHFEFKQHLEEPFRAKITRTTDRSEMSFFAENTQMAFENFEENLWNSKVSGSPLNDLDKNYNEVVFHPFRLQFLQANMDKNNLKLPEDSLKLKQIDWKLDSLQAVSKQMTINIIKEHSNSFLGLYNLNNHYNTISIEDSKILLASLSDDLKETPTGKKLTELIYKRGTLKAGDALPVFVLNDLKNREVLSKFLAGKYIFYNFWASWCGPCRKEHPELLELYKHRNAQKIEFVSISTDTDFDKREKAVAKDKLLWPQLIDKVGSNGLTVAQSMGIQGVPSNFFDR